MSEKKQGAETYKEKIEGAVKFNFWISSCPRSVYEEFKELSNKEFADTYHLALRYLLDNYKKNEREELFGRAVWEAITALERRLDSLEDKTPKEESSVVKKTFGKGVGIDE